MATQEERDLLWRDKAAVEVALAQAKVVRDVLNRITTAGTAGMTTMNPNGRPIGTASQNAQELVESLSYLLAVKVAEMAVMVG